MYEHLRVNDAILEGSSSPYDYSRSLTPNPHVKAENDTETLVKGEPIQEDQWIPPAEFTSFGPNHCIHKTSGLVVDRGSGEVIDPTSSRFLRASKDNQLLVQAYKKDLTLYYEMKERLNDGVNWLIIDPSGLEGLRTIEVRLCAGCFEFCGSASNRQKLKAHQATGKEKQGQWIKGESVRLLVNEEPYYFVYNLEGFDLGRILTLQKGQRTKHEKEAKEKEEIEKRQQQELQQDEEIPAMAHDVHRMGHVDDELDQIEERAVNEGMIIRHMDTTEDRLDDYPDLYNQAPSPSTGMNSTFGNYPPSSPPMALVPSNRPTEFDKSRKIVLHHDPISPERLPHQYRYLPLMNVVQQMVDALLELNTRDTDPSVSQYIVTQLIHEKRISTILLHILASSSWDLLDLVRTRQEHFILDHDSDMVMTDSVSYFSLKVALRQHVVNTEFWSISISSSARLQSVLNRSFVRKAQYEAKELSFTEICRTLVIYRSIVNTIIMASSHEIDVPTELELSTFVGLVLDVVECDADAATDALCVQVNRELVM